jgi:hypothetical protein
MSRRPEAVRKRNLLFELGMMKVKELTLELHGIVFESGAVAKLDGCRNSFAPASFLGFTVLCR